ncbi:MAG: hypothetical protein P8P99_06340 [Maricaulis sp.]|nr:hypothetical protein [Maricaulis sp.]
MKRQHRLLASAMLISLVATASEAQTGSAPAGPTRAQVLQARIAQERIPNLYAASYQPEIRQLPRERPRRVDIDWAQAIADARTQAGNQNFTAINRQPAPQVVRPSNRAAANANATRLPILLPPVIALGMENDPRVMLFPNEDFYTASIQGEGVLIEVFGTRLVNIATPPNPRAVRALLANDGDGFRVSQTEYGREISFGRYGAAYTITIECDAPETDARCSEPDFGRNLGRALLIAGGAPDEEG